MDIMETISQSMKNNQLWLIGDGDRNMEAVGAREIVNTIRYMNKRYQPTITRVLFNDPATIVWFSDGDKVVCVCDERDYFDKEKGVLHCIAKKFMGSTEVKRVSVEWEEEYKPMVLSSWGEWITEEEAKMLEDYHEEVKKERGI